MNHSRQRKNILGIIFLVVILAILIGFLFLGNSFNDNTVSRSFSKVYVTRGDIVQSVKGSGKMTDKDENTIEVPYEVKIEKILVHTGDKVYSGTALADVTESSVIKAISTCQADIERLRDKINLSKNEAVNSTIDAGVSGVVKIIYAEKGMKVLDCIATHGALATVSVDGYMAATIPRTNNSEDSYHVYSKEGVEYSSTILEKTRDSVTLGVADTVCAFNEEVDIYKNDEFFTKAILYIHKPINVLGVAGTIDDIWVHVNQKIDAWDTLFVLKDTYYDANYNTLLTEQSEKESDLSLLTKAVQASALVSPMDGTITKIDWTKDVAANSKGRIPIVTISPDVEMIITVKVNEYDVIAIQEGQTAGISFRSSVHNNVYGVVDEVNRISVNNDGKEEYSIRIVVPKSDDMLSGMQANVEIVTGQALNTLILPSIAVHYSKEGYYVYTAYESKDNSISGKRFIDIGIRNEDYTEIISGLQENDLVYY